MTHSGRQFFGRVWTALRWRNDVFEAETVESCRLLPGPCPGIQRNG